MLEKLSPLPPDPILGTTVACRNDPNPDKVDLGVGVYKDAGGNTPVFEAVVEAEARILAAQTTKAYVSPPGDSRFIEGVTRILFGEDHPVLADGRVGAVQAPGGSGALRVLAGVLLRAQADTELWVSTPTWGNHIPLLGAAGLDMQQYPYYDRGAHALSFDAMVEALKQRGPGEVVLLHGCCHNPSGADLTREQWDVVGDLAEERGFTPFIDFAYHGLGEGLDDDAYGVRMLARRVPELIVAYSASKNFGLYRERTGLAITVDATAEQAATATSQMANIARELYSMPPAHGASIVGEILADVELTASWTGEVTAMRDRLNGLRALLSRSLAETTGTDEFDYIAGERGLFSFLGLSPEQVQRLQSERSVYLIPSSRINVAGITEANVGYVAESIASVL
ncbi:aromatic amino acid transaminase [Euzebya sp.]|uniref:amino acid aminotransferase n=1 Tax=Euzebya sp. TaxID=1971409 RepID=UPI003510F496